MGRGRTSPSVKLTPPRTTAATSRRRLFQLLDRARNAHVVWLYGPPGSGKTTLAASYLAARRLPSLWYALDRADDDLATWFHFLARAAPQRRQPLPALTADRRAHVAVFARQFFDGLFARLQDRAVLVLDNFHDVSNDAGLDELVRIATGSLRGSQRILVLSRQPPPPAFAAAVIAGELVQIGEADLQFTLEELASLTRKRRMRVPRRTLEILHGRTHGWIAAIVCFLETGVDLPPETPIVLREFLFREYVQQLSPATRGMLLRLAFPRRLSTATVTALAGPRACAAMNELAQRGSFVVQLAGRSWELHPLLRELLLERAADELDGDELTRIRKLAARCCTTDGELDDAADLHADAMDWPALVRLVCDAAPMLLSQGREATLERWLARLPEDVLRDPWLELWRGQCRLHRDPVGACGHLTRAFEGFRNAGDLRGQLAAWPGVVSSMVASSDDLQSVDHWIGVLDELLAASGTPLDKAGAILLASLLFAINMRAPDHPRARAWGAKALEALETDEDELGILMLAGQLVEHGFWFGDPSTARHAWARMRRSPVPTGVLQVQLARAHAESLCALQLDDLAAARAAAAAGIATASAAGVPSTLLHATAARAELVAGDLEAARGHIAEMLAGSPPSSRLHTAHQAFLDAWEALLAGAVPRAIAQGAHASQLANDVGAVFPEAHSRALVAEARIEAGQLDAAARELARVNEIARATGSRALAVYALATTAHAALAAGDRHTAVARFAEALAAGREIGYSLLSTWPARRDTIAALCALALDADIDAMILVELIRIRRVEFSPPASLDCWPWPVRIRLCGGFALEVSGKATPARLSRQQRPIELLQLLVALGGHNIPESVICDTMWPDADGDRAEQTFEITLHRLRSLLGDSTLIRREHGRVTLDRKRVFADIWAIEELVHPVIAAKPPDPQIARRNVARAASLHAGPVLPEIASVWATRARTELAAKLERARQLTHGADRYVE